MASSINKTKVASIIGENLTAKQFTLVFNDLANYLQGNTFGLNDFDGIDTYITLDCAEVNNDIIKTESIFVLDTSGDKTPFTLFFFSDPTGLNLAGNQPFKLSATNRANLLGTLSIEEADYTNVPADPSGNYSILNLDIFQFPVFSTLTTITPNDNKLRDSGKQIYIVPVVDKAIASGTVRSLIVRLGFKLN